MKYSQARILLLLPYIGLWQLGYYERINEYIVVLIALFPLLLLRKRDIRVDRTALFSVLYGAVFIFLLLVTVVLVPPCPTIANGFILALVPTKFRLSVYPTVAAVCPKKAFALPAQAENANVPPITTTMGTIIKANNFLFIFSP